jgi:hypothetical protein
MKLYNQYNAAVNTPEIMEPLDKAFREVLEFIKTNNIDYREAELYCINHLQGNFAEAILRSAMKRHRDELVV